MRKLFVYVCFAVLLVCFGTAACSDNDYVPGNLTAAEVSFAFSVPDSLLWYADVTVIYNNDDGDNVVVGPVTNSDFRAVCRPNLAKLPVTVPFVVEYRPLNRCVPGINVSDWKICMDIETKVCRDGMEITYYKNAERVIDGDLRGNLDELVKDVRSRTYGVRIGNKDYISYTFDK